MFSKLAVNNVKKSMKDFTIYFLTLTFGVCLFYTFNSISSQQAMLALSASQKEMIKELQKMIGMVSIFISVILGFLIVYANQFLIKRRKKELGIYMLLGMDKSKISHILILETLNIGIFALCAGLFIGIFASQGLAVITGKMFDVQMKEFTFIFSMSAFIKSLLYFGIIFIVVMIFNTFTVSKYKLIDLFTAAKKNETLKVKKLWVSVILFLLSVVCLVIAYLLIIENGLTKFDTTFTCSIVFGTIGTFLFFLSLSGFLLKVTQGWKKFYFRGLNMFVLRQINSKITTTFVSMTLICLMLLLSIGILSSGAGLASTFNSALKEATPYDLTLTDYTGNINSITDKDYLLQELKKEGMDLNDLYKDCSILRIYRLENTMGEIIQYAMKEIPDLKDYFGDLSQKPIDFISLTEYNNNMKLQGKKTITLKNNQFAFVCNFNEFQLNYEKFIKNNDTLMINKKKFTPIPQILDSTYSTSGASQIVGTIVLPDNELKDSFPTKVYFNILFNGDMAKTSNFIKKQADTVYKEKESSFLIWHYKSDIYETSAGISTVVSYLAIYIGVIFLITCSAVLALQQLSESSDNMERYKLLRKIGVEERELRKSIFLQIFIYFMMPLSLALVHSVVGISVANKVIKMVGHIDASVGIAASATGIILVYGGYMVATYFGCKSMIGNKM